MKTIGMIGGMSWESSAHYYRILNEETRRRLGGVHSAPCLMHSLDFGEVERVQHAGDWPALTTLMIQSAQRLEQGGADFFLICSNTMHKLAGPVADSVAIPLLHIVDPTARAVKDAGVTRVGLLGTAFTMEEEFYKGRLSENFGLEVLVPDAPARALIHRVIYHELVAGKALPRSREALRAIIADLVAAGAGGIILGCTELMILVKPEDSAVPLFDTTELHALAAVDLALG